VRLDTALRAGTDPRRHALLMLRNWDAAMSGERPPHRPRALIAESWERLRRSGADPEHAPAPPRCPTDEVERRRHGCGLEEVLTVLREELATIAEDAVHLMIVADADGHVLWREGSAAISTMADQAGLVVGSRCDEASVGTSAIGTSLALRRPVQVFATEHYFRAQHGWSCAAAPMHDPVDGRLLGVVDVSSRWATVHPATLALVHSVTRLAQSELSQRQGVALARLRGLAAPVLARTGGPAFVTDRHGRVAAATGIAPGGQVPLPDAPGRGCSWIPSIGTCVCEPLFDGWLIRVDATEPARDTTVRLKLDDPKPSVVVASPSDSWRCDLSPRQAEILLLLADHPNGRSARELSIDLFGDPAHQVTVRAEMSRLRRRLGSLLAQRPYRFAPGLRVHLG